MSNFYFDIWYRILSYLTPIEQAKLRRTNRLLNDAYLSHNINKKKHGFFEFVYEWEVLIYRFKLSKDKKDIWIKNRDKIEKRRLMRNKEVNYYCEGIDKNAF